VFSVAIGLLQAWRARGRHYTARGVCLQV